MLEGNSLVTEKRTDIERLEAQILNLRYAIGSLFFVVLFLTGYLITQWILGYSNLNFSVLALLSTMILILLLICTIYSMTIGIEKKQDGVSSKLE